jgi:hypothetical protein
LKQLFETEFTFTVYPHAFTRVIRPILSPTAYSVATLFIERYFGYHLPETKWIKIPYTQMMRETGIKKHDTITRVINELSVCGIIKVKSGKKERKASRYLLRIGNLRVAHQIMVEHKHKYIEASLAYLEFLVDQNDLFATPKNGVSTTPKNGVSDHDLLRQKMACLKERLLKESINENQSEEESESLASVMEIIGDVEN